MSDREEELVEILRAIQWAGDEHHWVCPECRQDRRNGHAVECRLAKALQDPDGA